jgi:site-specific recombinase XerC
VQDLTRFAIERLIKHLWEDQGLSHRSVSFTLGVIKQVLSYGITEGAVAVNVAASVKAPRKQHSKAVADTRAKDEPWTMDEVLHFRAVAMIMNGRRYGG